MTDGPTPPVPPNSTALRELAHAVENALTLPRPATTRDELTYLRIVRDRARLVRQAMRAAALPGLEAPLTEYEHPHSLASALAREFAAWEVDAYPGGVGVVTAFWCSPDGRSRRFVVRRSTSELLARLRAIGPVPS